MASAMETRTLGPLQVSTVGLGCNNLGREGYVERPKDVDALIGACRDAGITFLDTAALYGGPESLSETLLGKALRGRRDDFVVATKFGHERGTVAGEDAWGPKGSRGYIRKAVEGSLRRLQTDWIDLYQHHTPDPTTPVAETIAALEELVVEGKIRCYGNSQYSEAQLREADAAARELGATGYVSAQDEYSLLARGVEADRLSAARELGLAFIPFFPLASGLLTGKYREDHTPEDSRLAKQPHRLVDVPWSRIEAFRGLCVDLGQDMTQTAIAWLLAQAPVVSVIAGATKPAQVFTNAQAAALRMPADVLGEIGEIFA